MPTGPGSLAAQVVLGGDHLGPNPWRHLPAEAALAEAEAMVAAYVAAGYEKIHLDTSMGCQGEPEHLPDEVTAERAARLAVVAQAAAGEPPRALATSSAPRCRSPAAPWRRSSTSR